MTQPAFGETVPGVWIGKKLRSLTPAELEDVLAIAPLFESVTGSRSSVQWSRAAKVGVLLDLSSVEWIEIGALVQLTLIAEKAVRDGIPVSIALPYEELRVDEIRWVGASASTDRINRSDFANRKKTARQRARRFLEYMRFGEALAAPHFSNGRVDIWPSFDLGVFEEGEEELGSEFIDRGEVPPSDGDRVDRSDETYKFDVPLTWLASSAVDGRSGIAKLLAGIIGERNRGLHDELAKALANVVLYELVDNVDTHSGGPRFALVAASVRSEHFFGTKDPQQVLKGFLSYERSYLNWMIGSPRPVVEVVVGDSGIGIPHRLGPQFDQSAAPKPFGDNRTANILAWAVERWSSSQDRGRAPGTRGLYRVDRVVKRAQGLLAIRSVDVAVAVDHGGLNHDVMTVASEDLPVLPGTVIRLRLPVVRVPTFAARAASAGHVAKASAGPMEVQLGGLSPAGLEEQDLERLRGVLQSAARLKSPKPVLALVSGGNDEKGALEAFMRQVVELRHPTALAVHGLPGSSEQIASAIDSVNEELWRHGRHDDSVKADQHGVWSPVLITAQHKFFGWVGAEESVGRLLSALMHSGRLSRSAVIALLPDPAVRLHVLQFLRGDTYLIEVGVDGSVQFIPQFTVEGLSEALEEHIKGERTGVVSGPFLSPSLVARRLWLDVPAVLSASVGTYVPLFLLAERIYSTLGPTLQPDLVAGDTTSKRILIDGLARQLDVTTSILPGDGGVPLPRGSTVFPSGASVVIFREVLASADSVRRILAQVRRDKATAVVVACIIDAREKPGSPIEAWDRQVPVVSVAKVDLCDDLPSGVKPTRYIGPDGHDEEIAAGIGEVVDVPLAFPEGKLQPLVDECQALHLGHTGDLLGRHFTLYLDAEALLEKGAIIDAFDKAAREWLDEGQQSVVNTEIWFPTPEPEISGPASRIAGALHRRLGCPADGLKAIRRRSQGLGWSFVGRTAPAPGRGVIIVDWGALSGGSITRMVRLAADAGAVRVMACVFLSQLSADEESFLASLRVVRGYSNDAGQIQLSFEPAVKPPVTRTNVPCEIRFLGHFAVSVFGPLDCPVCELRNRLQDEQLPTPFLRDYSKGEHSRLRLRNRGEASAEPAVLASVMAIRELLTDAQRSTRKRAQFADLLREWAQAVTEDATAIPQDALLLVRLLAFEHYWLRWAPLNLARQRDDLASVASKFAQNESLSEEERVNAVAVLRVSSKSEFASNLTCLVVSGASHRRLLQQLLYNTLTCFQRPYRQSLQVVRTLKAGLDELVHLAATEQRLPVECHATLRTLAVRAEVEIANSEVSQLTMPEAWKRLREQLNADHHDHDGNRGHTMKMVLLRPFGGLLNDAVITRQHGERPNLPAGVLGEIQSASSSWSSCGRWLDVFVLPLLRVMREVLQSREFSRTVGNAAVARFLQLCDSTTVAESELSRMIESFAVAPEKLIEPQAWSVFRQETRWFYENIFMDEPLTNTMAPFRAFFGPEPTTFRSAFKAARQEMKTEGLQISLADDLDSSVAAADRPLCCPPELLQQAVKQVLKNVPDHHIEGQPSPEVRIKCTELQAEGLVSFEVRNNNTSAEIQGRRVGLLQLRDRLEPFGTIVQDIRPEDGWSTYVVELKTRAEPRL